MALSWILKDDKVISVLIGASKPEQILDNIKIIGHTDFIEEELQKIETIVQGWHWSTKMGAWKKNSPEKKERPRVYNEPRSFFLL